MLADCYQRCLHPKLCIHEALPFASCVQGCGRTSETRLCCPTCIEPGNSILWYLHLAAIHAFFLHSAEPSVKLVEIVFTHSTKCISTNLFKKITVHNMHLFKDPSETTRAFRQSGLIPQFTRFSVSVAWVESQRLGQTSFFCGQEWNRSVGGSGVKNLNREKVKNAFVGTKYYELM